MGDIPVKEISELLDMASAKVPQLAGRLIAQIFSREAGTNMGQAVGSLYRELVEAGVPQEDALSMAKEYLLSINEMIKSFGGNMKTTQDSGEDDVG
jgi:hypothetical protein